MLLKSVGLALVAIIVLGVSSHAVSEEVAGRWNLAVKTPHGDMNLALEIRLDGKKVTGSLSNDQFGKQPLTGEYADGKLTFSVSSDVGDLAFVGKFKDKDKTTLVGTLTGHGGDMPCSATRTKDK